MAYTRYSRPRLLPPAGTEKKFVKYLLLATFQIQKISTTGA